MSQWRGGKRFLFNRYLTITNEANNVKKLCL